MTSSVQDNLVVQMLGNAPAGSIASVATINGKQVPIAFSVPQSHEINSATDTTYNSSNNSFGYGAGVGSPDQIMVSIINYQLQPKERITSSQGDTFLASLDGTVQVEFDNFANINGKIEQVGHVILQNVKAAPGTKQLDGEGNMASFSITYVTGSLQRTTAQGPESFVLKPTYTAYESSMVAGVA